MLKNAPFSRIITYLGYRYATYGFSPVIHLQGNLIKSGHMLWELTISATV